MDDWGDSRVLQEEYPELGAYIEVVVDEQERIKNGNPTLDFV